MIHRIIGIAVVGMFFSFPLFSEPLSRKSTAKQETRSKSSNISSEGESTTPQAVSVGPTGGNFFYKQQKPDLTVSIEKLGSNLFRICVKNEGAGPSGKANISLHRLYKPVNTWMMLPMPYSCPPLLSGQQNVIQVVHPPHPQAELGEHSYKACVDDYENKVDEMNESNNCSNVISSFPL